MTVRIIRGDCRNVLRLMRSASVHCCVTSPPYWGIRDYGVASQIGLEDSPEAFIAELVQVFREVRRVLREDGTLWLNLGDSYVGSRRGGAGDKSTLEGSLESQNASRIKRTNQRTKSRRRDGAEIPRNDMSVRGLKPKDLVGMPWRIALALQADGWWLRQDIIWSKPNPMPESVADRCTKAHEYIFLLSKSQRYYFDAKAIAEPLADSSVQQNGITRNKRSVWEIATVPFDAAHFATFPPALAKPCVMAGCPRGGTVLDPFAGAGTTGLVADRLGRDAIMIELNGNYADMAERRLTKDGGMFANIRTEQKNPDHEDLDENRALL